LLKRLTLLDMALYILSVCPAEAAVVLQYAWSLQCASQGVKFITAMYSNSCNPAAV